MPNLIERIGGLLTKATPGKRRVAMHGYNVKSDLSGTPHDGDCYENIFAVPSGPKATLRAVEQFQHDADLEVALFNAAPALMDALRESVDVADQLRELRGALAAGPLARDVISRRLALIEAALRSKLAALENL